MARTFDDPVVQERLHALLRAVVDEKGNEGEAAKALDVAQPQVSLWLNRRRNVPANVVPALAAATNTSVDELVEIGPPPWSQAPGWEPAIAQARALFPRVRTAAFQRVGAIREKPPAELDPAKLGLLASMFDKKVGDV